MGRRSNYERACKLFLKYFLSYIIFENDDVIVFNKPAFIPTEQTRHYALGLKELISMQVGYLVYPVHRLDKDTTGVLLFVKRKKLLSKLQGNTWGKITKKKYLAVIDGIWDIPDEGLYVDMPLDIEGYKVTVEKDGKNSQSTFKTLSINEVYTLVEVQIHTGRKHQIRVHASHLGYPILGDERYNPERRTNFFFRQLLHARELKIDLSPIGGKLNTFIAELPKDFEKFLIKHDLFYGMSHSI